MHLHDDDYSDNEDVGNAYGDMDAGMLTPPELLGVDGADAMLEEARMLNPHRQRHSTKPRSVAERKRREKISVRLQQLKDAMPKAEGRLDTASMIEDAVAYIQSLRQRCRALEKHNVQLSAKVEHLQERLGERDGGGGGTGGAGGGGGGGVGEAGERGEEREEEGRRRGGGGGGGAGEGGGGGGSSGGAGGGEGGGAGVTDE
ncbi:hypothetical protein CLOM_g21756 [Closterium sp. NIES-68]|nr:hypothetical protein CLOM_g21756 [Closterium sp. NIES-68]